MKQNTDNKKSLSIFNTIENFGVGISANDHKFSV